MKERLITGIIAGVFLIVMTIMGGYAFSTVLVVMAIIGLFEFSRMNHQSWHSPIHILSLIALLSLVIPFEQYGLKFINDMTIIWLTLFVLLAYTVISKNKVTIDEVALSFVGTVYIGIGFSSIIDVRIMENHGFFWCCFAFCVIWSSDIGAYFFGRAFGKHKLWPQISPNKTIEGAIGGIVSSIIVAVLFAVLAKDIVELWRAILIGFTAAIAGQLGDLIQSAYKRVRGIKDMGKLLPGHGGIIDRCDSWIIVFPILVLTELIPV